MMFTGHSCNSELSRTGHSMKNIAKSNDIQKDDHQLPSNLSRLMPWGPVFQLFEFDLGHEKP